MSQRLLPGAVALIVLATALGGCASRRSDPVASNLGEDDDAFCRGKGLATGSSEYAACRKDRDAQRGNATARADRAQRNLGELMLNTPSGPDQMRR